MTINLSNHGNISLPLATWLAHEHYNQGEVPFKGIKRVWSATELLKPTRAILLNKLISEKEKKTFDISSKANAKIGVSIHKSIEDFWSEEILWKDTMRNMNIPLSVIERILINPSANEIKEDSITIITEKRAWKPINPETAITGQADIIYNGTLHDIKTTSVASWTNKNTKEKWRLQGSIYKWLMPELITNNFINIDLIFTNWNSERAKRAKSKEEYPPFRVVTLQFKLYDSNYIQSFINRKVNELELFLSQEEFKDQSNFPVCNPSDLWMGETQYKYWSTEKAYKQNKRAYRVFTSASDAEIFKASKGDKGIIIPFTGTPKACSWCPASPICEQRESMGLNIEGNPYEQT